MDQVSQIRSKADIVSLISEYLPLKKMGRNFKANCPFHNEKTPSFVVSPERQIWHCFGCSKGGDAFTFLMEYERLEFPEALRILAQRVGIKLERFTGFSGETSSKKEKIYKLNRQVMDFYHYILLKHNAGKRALNYILEKRKIKEKIIETFMLGFSPVSAHALSDYLIKKKEYKKEDLIDAGLAYYRSGGIFDFFAGRIMFPLFDHRNNIIGFSGRVMDSSDQDSKYINTRETFVYHKGDVFFGLNITKENIKKENQAIIMEGELDVISSFQTGITNAVAVKGTALTENQVSLISRFAQKVTLCFDEDKAGEAAIKRSLQNLEKKGLTTTVIVIPNGKDPDESIKDNPYSFKKAVKEDINVYDYLISKNLTNFNKKTAEGKKKIGDELLPIIFGIENEIVKEHYYKKLSLELETSYESIVKQVQRLEKKQTDNLNIVSLKDKKNRKEILEEYLLALLFQSKNIETLIKKIKNLVFEEMFGMLSFKKIFVSLLNYFEETDTFDTKKFSESLAVELLPSFDICFLKPVPKFEDEKTYEKEVIKKCRELRLLYLKNKIKDLGEKIKLKEKTGEEQELRILNEEVLKITSLLGKT